MSYVQTLEKTSFICKMKFKIGSHKSGYALSKKLTFSF